jgi:hypothetical protein
MDFTSRMTQYHNDLASIMRPFQGQVLTTADITQRVQQALGREVAQWVQPSDHCINHTPEGACECAGTDRAVFERIERGRYQAR